MSSQSRSSLVSIARHAVLALLLVGTGDASAEEFLLRDGQRVVFLGDSITFVGGYVQYLDAYLFTRFPDQKFELINLGLPSETASGLSEPDHPYPRPNVHERLERALTKLRPHVVVACYGMNDGIYHPFSPERFQEYQSGIRRLIEQVEQSGARLILMTPPPFDPQPLGDKVLPLGAEKYSWMNPYKDYNEVLSQYAQWLLTEFGEKHLVVDVHGAVGQHLSKIRIADPAYLLAKDGIHPDANGSWLIAQELLLSLHAPPMVDIAEIDLDSMKVKRGEIVNLSVNQGVIRLSWMSRVPMPSDPNWDRRLTETERITERLNQHRMILSGAPAEHYDLYEGDERLGRVERADLERGIDLGQYPKLSSNARTGELRKLVDSRERHLRLGWLAHVGHQHPDVKRTLTIDTSQSFADQYEARIREIVKPQVLTLELRPAVP